ncbi:MAG: hypothetical protein IT435_06880 [Phycisphaerales bacterium]|nr:hypothetical protein [Phycisphaerales bacterium]
MNAIVNYRTNRSHVLAVALLAATASLASAEVITLRSGQVGGLPGSPTQVDDTITFGNTVPTGPLSANPFTAADFNATTANPAIVINAYGSWLPGLTFDTQARWIGTGLYQADPFYPNLGAPSSALYRAPFTVTTTGITSAVISIAWAADDNLGDVIFGGPNPIGAYLRDPSGNVTALTPVAGGGYGIETTVLNYNITGAIDTGVNELFMYQRDAGSGISGLIFGAEMRIVPGPGSAALLALGGIAIARRRR